MRNKVSYSILVVEDQVPYCKAIKDCLKGHSVIFAYDAEDAVDLFKRHAPDITFLDIGLPDADGFKVLSSIKKINANAYVVMLTASHSSEDVIKSQLQGAQGYIVKPFEQDKIDQYIDKYFMYRKAVNLLYPTVEQPKEASLKGDASLASKPRKQMPERNKRSAAQQALLKKIRILFIDSYEANRFNAKKELKKCGYDIDVAESLEEMFTLNSTFDYDFIFLDCDFENEKSYEAVGIIREEDKAKNKNRLIVGLSEQQALPEEENSGAPKWLSMGMNALFNKPIPIKKINQYILDNFEVFKDKYGTKS